MDLCNSCFLHFACFSAFSFFVSCYYQGWVSSEKEKDEEKDRFLKKVKDFNQDDGKQIKELLDLGNPLWMSLDALAIVLLLV